MASVQCKPITWFWGQSLQTVPMAEGVRSEDKAPPEAESFMMLKEGKIRPLWGNYKVLFKVIQWSNGCLPHMC